MPHPREATQRAHSTFNTVHQTIKPRACYSSCAWPWLFVDRRTILLQRPLQSSKTGCNRRRVLSKEVSVGDEVRAPASMVVCSSRSRAVTSAFICRWRVGSSGNGYRLAPNASQICSSPQWARYFKQCTVSAQQCRIHSSRSDKRCQGSRSNKRCQGTLCFHVLTTYALFDLLARGNMRPCSRHQQTSTKIVSTIFAILKERRARSPARTHKNSHPLRSHITG